jgi:hypothetical protein
MSFKSIPNLKTQINTLLPDNSTAAISAADVRTNMLDAADSLAPVDHTHTNAEVNTSIATNPAASATAMGLGTANTPTFAGLKATGNVGIGTTSPSAKLEVAGSSKFLGTTHHSWFNIGSSEDTFIRGGKATSKVYINDSHSADVVIASGGGNVGIGTTTPDELLHVAAGASGGTYTADRQLIIEGSGQAGIQISSTGTAGIEFGDAASAVSGRILYQHDINAMRLFTATAERMRIDSTGNVGIGTASPAYKLDIFGKVGFHTDGSMRWGNAFDSGKLTWDTGKAVIRGETGKALSLGANGTQDYLYITTTGNVGIGTTAPTGKLNIETASSQTALQAGDLGTLLSTSSASTSNTTHTTSPYLKMVGGIWNGSTNTDRGFIQQIVGVSGANYGYRLNIGSTDIASAMSIVGVSGNVGIGTTSPSDKLEVAGNINVAGSSARIGFNAGNMAVKDEGGYKLGFQTYNSTSGTIATKMVLDTNGNVGIGTTSPANKLDIRQGTTSGSDVLGVGAISIGSDNPYWTFRGTAISLQDLAFDRSYGGTWYESMRIQRSSGNVGIGTTSPTAPLAFGKTVYGAPSSEGFYRIKFEDSGGVDNDIGIGQPTSGSLGFNVAANGYISFNEGTSGERVRIAAGGNVGIGTTTPYEKLDVVGNIKASGTVKTGSQTVSVATASSSATAVAAGEGAMTYISNESGGATIAFSDGIVWRRVSDRAPIS